MFDLLFPFISTALRFTISHVAIIFFILIEQQTFDIEQLPLNRRSFPVAASILWNKVPPDIQSSASLTDFCHDIIICSNNHSQTLL